MTKILTAAWAAFGLVAAGAVAAIVATGLLEGTGAVPEWASSAAGVVVFLAATLLAGKVCDEIAGPRAFTAATVTTAATAILGWAAAAASESAGEGLEPHTVAYVAAGLAVLLGSSVGLARRRRRRRTRPVPGAGVTRP